jgi:hypothetical protein
MDLEETSEEVAGQSIEKSGSSSLQKEAVRSSACKTMTMMTMVMATGMQKIDEGNKEEEVILGMKTRNWKKINLSFAVEVNGQDADDIRAADPQEGNNKRMKHQPIMSKLANFMAAVEKKYNTLKVI